jgi:DNA-binding SARP family transcriptional activator
MKDKEFLTKSDLFISMVTYGNIPHSFQFEWLDRIKASYESDVLSCLYELCDNFFLKEDYLACMDTSNVILQKYDQFDETALVFKIVALNKMKGHSKAQNEYELFKKRYFTTYQEEYKRTIEEIIQLRK